MLSFAESFLEPLGPGLYTGILFRRAAANRPLLIVRGVVGGETGASKGPKMDVERGGGGAGISN